MFSNLYDTVRNTHLDHVQMEATFMKAILNRSNPILSLNMLVDSPLVLALVQKHPEFLSFASNKVIRASLFGTNTCIMDYLKGHLENAHEKTGKPYNFSSLPFLTPGKEYEEAHIRKIYHAMWLTLQGDTNRITADLLPSDEHRSMIRTSIELIQKLSRALEGNYIPPIPDYSPVLSQRIDQFAATVQQKNPDIPLPLELQMVQDKFRMQRKQLCINPDGSQDHLVVNDQAPKTSGMIVSNEAFALFTKRSHMYHIFSRNSPTPENETKAIIDLCYNEKVAASVCDNEDDLMVNTYSYSILDDYLQSDGSPMHSQCITCLDPADQAQDQIFTWELVKTIYDKADRLSKRIEDWNENVARCCEEFGLPAFEPGIGNGNQPITILPTVLAISRDTDYAIYQENTRNFLRRNAGCRWSMDTDNPNATDPDANEPADFRQTTGTTKTDYAHKE